MTTDVIPTTEVLANDIAVKLGGGWRKVNQKTFTVTYRGISFTVRKDCQNVVLTLAADESRNAINTLTQVIEVATQAASDLEFGLRLVGLNQSEASFFEKRNFESVNRGEYWQMV